MRRKLIVAQRDDGFDRELLCPGAAAPSSRYCGGGRER
jgi:hypothetical protein